MQRLALILAIGSLLALCGFAAGADQDVLVPESAQIEVPSDANPTAIGSLIIDRLVDPNSRQEKRKLNQGDDLPNPTNLATTTTAHSCPPVDATRQPSDEPRVCLDDLLTLLLAIRPKESTSGQLSVDVFHEEPPRPRARIVLAPPTKRTGDKRQESKSEPDSPKVIEVLTEGGKVAVLPFAGGDCDNSDEPGGLAAPVGPMNPLGPYDPEGVVATFSNPVEKVVVSSGFGGPRGNGPHLGVDFCGNVGTPILSAGNGRVVYAGALSPFEAYGEIVVIDHGCGVYTLYGHVDPDKRLRQKRGPRSYVPVQVKAGTRVAQVGRTKSNESSTGPHLHFEIMVIKRQNSRVRYTFFNPACHLPYARKPEQEDHSIAQRKAPAGRPTIPASPNRALWAVLNVLDYPVEVYSERMEDTSPVWNSRLARGPSGFQTSDLLAGLAAVRDEALGTDKNIPYFVQAAVSVAGDPPVRRKKTGTSDKLVRPMFPLLYGHQTWIPHSPHLKRRGSEIRPGWSEIIPFDIPGSGNPY